MAKRTIEARVAALTKRIEQRKKYIIRLSLPLEYWEKQLEELNRLFAPAA